MTFFLDFDRTLFDTERYYTFLERAHLVPGEHLPQAEDLRDFLYPDTIPFLAAHAAHELVLVTRGDPELQRMKAEKSGVLAYIPHALYVDVGTKASAIAKHIKQHPGFEPIFFLDDVVTEHEAVRVELPNIVCVRMRRPDARTSLEPGPKMPELTALSEFTRIVVAPPRSSRPGTARNH